MRQVVRCQSVGPRRRCRRRRFPGGGRRHLCPRALSVLTSPRRASLARSPRALLPRVSATLRGARRGTVVVTAGPLVAPEPRQPAPGASRALRRIYQGALRAMPLQHRRDRAHSPRVVMAPPLRRAISPLCHHGRGHTTASTASTASPRSNTTDNVATTSIFDSDPPESR